MSNDHFSELTEQGLNLIAVFNLADLPESIKLKLAPQEQIARFDQLVLIAHGGRDFWQAVRQQPEHWQTSDPLDHFTLARVTDWLLKKMPVEDFTFLYPFTGLAVPLQALGEMAGWHYPSPFRVGVNNQWGSWFAYRALVLVKKHFSPRTGQSLGNPCLTCSEKNCLKACPVVNFPPGEALDHQLATAESIDLTACIDYRCQTGSACRQSCLARLACPVASQHSYSQEQIQYHYRVSLKAIEKFYRPLK